jgi:hypothetical protein
VGRTGRSSHGLYKQATAAGGRLIRACLSGDCCYRFIGCVRAATARIMVCNVQRQANAAALPETITARVVLKEDPSHRSYELRRVNLASWRRCSACERTEVTVCTQACGGVCGRVCRGSSCRHVGNCRAR